MGLGARLAFDATIFASRSQPGTPSQARCRLGSTAARSPAKWRAFLPRRAGRFDRRDAVFVPYAGVTPMLAQAAVVGRTLADRGHRVVFALLPVVRGLSRHGHAQTPVRSHSRRQARKLPALRDNSLTMLNEYGLPTIDLRSLVTSSMRQRIEHRSPRPPPIWEASSSRGSHSASSA